MRIDRAEIGAEINGQKRYGSAIWTGSYGNFLLNDQPSKLGVVFQREFVVRVMPVQPIGIQKTGRFCTCEFSHLVRTEREAWQMVSSIDIDD